MNINLRNILTKARITYDQVRGVKEVPKLPKLLGYKEVPDFEGGIQYHGFKYYPRFPGEKDPPYEPTKLFLIERLNPTIAGTNYVEKGILREFDIAGRRKHKGHLNIVKNTPQVNAKLWKIKHLIKITPIRFVNGLPKDGDLSGCWLKSNGDFVISPKLKIEEERVKSFDDFKQSVNIVDRDTLKQKLRLDWQGPFSGVIEE